MTRSTLVCFAWTAYKAPLLKADLEAVYERNSDFTKLNFLIRLSSTPPLRRSLSTDRQLNWQLRTWLIVRQECTIHSSHPAAHIRDPLFCKNAFSHSIISVHSESGPWQGFHLSTPVPRFHGILHWDLINHEIKLEWDVAVFWNIKTTFDFKFIFDVSVSVWCYKKHALFEFSLAYTSKYSWGFSALWTIWFQFQGNNWDNTKNINRLKIQWYPCNAWSLFSQLLPKALKVMISGIFPFKEPLRSRSPWAHTADHWQLHWN